MASGRQFQGATVNLDPAVVVELVEPVLQLVNLLLQTGHQAVHVAFEKTGLLVTEQNQHLIPENDLAEWDAAIEEYERKHGGQEGTG